MCVVLAAVPAIMMYASLAISAATTAMSVVSQQQQANAANDAAKAQAESAAASARNQYYLNNLRTTQEAEATSQNIQQRNTEALKAQSTAATAAGEASVSGISVDALMADYDRTSAQFREVQKTNLSNTGQQIAAQQEGVFYQAQDRTNQAKSMRKPGPNYFGAALGLAGQAVDAYGSYIDRTTKPPRS